MDLARRRTGSRHIHDDRPRGLRQQIAQSVAEQEPAQVEEREGAFVPLHRLPPPREEVPRTQHEGVHGGKLLGDLPDNPLVLTDQTQIGGDEVSPGSRTDAVGGGQEGFPFFRSRPMMTTVSPRRRQVSAIPRPIPSVPP